MPHWKYTATRCAVEGCERQRVKGRSTCALSDHYVIGKRLAGAGRIAPIPQDTVTELSVLRKAWRGAKGGTSEAAELRYRQALAKVTA